MRVVHLLGVGLDEQVETSWHLPLPQLQVVQKLDLLHGLHVQRALLALAGIPEQPGPVVQVEVLDVPALLLSQLPEGLLADWLDMEVVLLELLNHQLLDSTLDILDELLVAVVLLQVQLIQDYFFGLFEVLDDWRSVVCLVLSLYEMSEVVEDLVIGHRFLVEGLVESLYVSESHTLLLGFILGEHLRTESIGVALLQDELDIVLTELGQVLQGHYFIRIGNIQASQVRLLDFDDLGELEFVGDEGFFGVVAKGQVNQMEQTIVGQPLFLGDVEDDDQDFGDVHVLLVQLLLNFEQDEWILLDLENPVLECWILPICHLDGLVDGLEHALSPFSPLSQKQIHEGVGQQSKVRLSVVGVDILNDHEGYGQSEELGIQQWRQIDILQRIQREYCVDLLDGTLSDFELELVLVLGQVHTVDGFVESSQFRDNNLPGVDHGAVESLDLEGITNNWEGLNKIVLGLAHIQPLQKVWLLEHLLLGLQGEDRRLLGAGSVVEFGIFEGLLELLLDLGEVSNSNTLQGQCLLVVFARDCSDTKTFSRLELAELLGAQTFRQDSKLLNIPLNPHSDIPDHELHSSQLERFELGRILLQNREVILFLVSGDQIKSDFVGILRNGLDVGQGLLVDLGVFGILALNLQQVDPLHPPSQTVGNTIDVEVPQGRHWMNNLVLAWNSDLQFADLIVKKHPSTLEEVRAGSTPRELLHQRLNLQFQAGAEAVLHRFEFVKEGLLTRIFDQIQGWNGRVAGVVQFPQCHGDAGGEPGLDTQTDEVNLSALASLKLFEFVWKTRSIGCVLPIRNENNCEVDLHNELGHLPLKLFEGTEDVSPTSTVILEILTQVAGLLNPRLIIEGNDELGQLSNRGVPEFDHFLPVGTH